MADDTATATATESAAASAPAASPAAPAAPASTPAPPTGKSNGTSSPSLFEAAATPASTPDAPSEADAPADAPLILGKYKTTDDLAKAYKELESKLGSTPKAPDKYDRRDEVFDKAGLKWKKDDAAWDTFQKDLRDHGITQEQFEFISQLGGAWLQDQLRELGPGVDVEVEMAQLKDVWGDTATERVGAVGDWATRHLHADVITKPLNQTAEGIKFLASLMRNESGLAPITDAQADADMDDDLQAQLGRLQRDDEYWRPGPVGAALQAKADKIIEQMIRQGKRPRPR